MIDSNKYRNEILLLLIFIVVNVTMYLFSIDAAPLAVGADAGQYLRPARSMVDFGEFTMNPSGWTPEMGESRPFTFGTPLYSILLAIPYYFFGQGEIFYATVIVIQCSLLYLIGYISRFFLQFFNSSRTMLIHILVIFNPNSLTTAHLIQSETLFTLFVVITLLYIFKYIKYGSKNNLIIMGISVGLLALTRPAGLYFVYMIPVILIVVQVFRLLQNRGIKEKGITFTSLVSFFIPVLVAFLIMSPWYIRNYVNNSQIFLATGSGYYLKDNYINLVHRGGASLTSQEINEIFNREQLKYFKKNGIGVECLNNGRDPNCDKHVFRAVLTAIFNEPIETHIKALVNSWGILYFSGGASNFRNYVGLKGNSLIVDFQQEKYQGFDSIIRLIKRMDVGYLLIFIVFTSFAVITRFIGIIGFYRNIKNTDTIIYLIAIVGVLIIFTAMYLYLGQSRFRVPLEPILMLLTVLAFNKKSINTQTKKITKKITKKK
jgi:4-amino-4-deoxy-L-arabinose transferase-like glycosyltransferase